MSTGPRHATAQTARKCASCGARLRSDEQWCSLCHTAVSPIQGEPQPGREPSAEPVPQPEPKIDPAVDAVAARLLAELAAAEALRDQGTSLGALQQRLGGLSRRTTVLLLAGLGGTLLLVLAILGLTLIGLLV